MSADKVKVSRHIGGHKTTLAVTQNKLAAACRSFYEWSLGLGRRKKMARLMGRA